MYRVTQPFNGKYSTRFSGGAAHGAIDFAAPTGTPVVAPDDGVIVHADWAWNLPGGPDDWVPRWFQLKPAVNNRRGGGGIMTVLRNDAGSHWIFAHLSSNDEAPVGKRVKRGDIIGKTGNTGTSTGPHLHLGLVPGRPNWSNGTYGSIDPAPWLTIPYAPNTYTSWTGTATKGTGSASKAGTAAATTATSWPKNWIDVSDYQPTTVIRDVPTYAAIIKATEGVGWSGKKTAGHVKAAQAKGIPWMLYHFARPLSNSSDAEVDYFLKVARPYLSQKGFSGLVLDWEEDKAGAYARWASDFLARLRAKAPGVHLVLYTRRDFLTASGWRPVDKKVPVWIAAYGSDKPFSAYATSFAGAPSVAGWNIAAWQYSRRGRFKGYAGDLDLNRTLNGTMWPSPTTKAKPAAKGKHVATKQTTTKEATIASIDLSKIIIPPKGDATGDMTALDNEGWARHERVRQEEHRVAVEDHQERVEHSLNVIAAGVSKILAHTEKETTNG
jgi:GH25 family lysozyme M1 (1,4-beta-N-acetylmuramidase)